MIAICADLHGNQYRLADIMQQLRWALIEKGTGIQSWWPEEVPNAREMAHGLENLQAAHFELDYILTHTAPASVIARMGFATLLEETEFAAYLDRLQASVSFKQWFFGHFHMDWQDDRFLCLWNNITFL